MSLQTPSLQTLIRPMVRKTLFLGVSPVPSELVALFEAAAQHSDPLKRFRFYAVLAKFRRQGASLLQSNDADLRAVKKMALQVERETLRILKRMRFTRYSVETADFLEAWCEPKYLILDRIGEFFRKQMPNIRWVVRTPEGAVTWDLKEVSVILGTLTNDAPETQSLAS